MPTRITKEFLIGVLLLLLPGCRGYINWGGCPWHHRSEAVRQIEEGRRFAQSTAVFARYSARIVFDALPLADQVRVAYTRMVAGRYGKSKKWLETELAKQVACNKKRVRFYVLALRELPFGDQCGQWVPQLSVDGAIYKPLYIQHVDPSVEYKHILGPRYTRFKIIYEIAFPGYDGEGQPVVPSTARSVALIFESYDKKAIMSWDVGADGVTFGDEKSIASNQKER